MSILTLESEGITSKSKEYPLLQIASHVSEKLGIPVVVRRLETGYVAEVPREGFAHFARTALEQLDMERPLASFSEVHHIDISESDGKTSVSCSDCGILEIVLRAGFNLLRKSGK